MFRYLRDRKILKNWGHLINIKIRWYETNKKYRDRLSQAMKEVHEESIQQRHKWFDSLYPKTAKDSYLNDIRQMVRLKREIKPTPSHLTD